MKIELVGAHELERVFGVPARRGCQFQGGTDSPDLVTGLAGVHFEVKRTERLDLADAVQQAARAAVSNIPAVLHRRNRTPWLVVLRLEVAPLFAALVGAISRPL